MKSEDDIRKRLDRLRRRHEHKYVQARIGRRPENCVNNHVHTEKKLPYSRSDFQDELELSPRVSKTLIVLDDGPRQVRLCMLGAEDPSSWSMDVCDRTETAKACPHFRPKVSEDAIREQFAVDMRDDKYVAERYPDVASLQWVLRGGPKRWPWPLSWFVWLWRKANPLPEPELEPQPEALPEPDTDPDLDLKDLWDDPVQDTRA